MTDWTQRILRAAGPKGPRQIYVRALRTDRLVEALEAAEEKAETEPLWQEIMEDLLEELTVRTLQNGGVPPEPETTGYPHGLDGRKK